MQRRRRAPAKKNRSQKRLNKDEDEEEYVIESFAGRITSFPSLLEPGITVPSILVRYAGYGPEDARWESIKHLQENGLGEEVQWFNELFLPFYKDFQVNDGILSLPAPKVPLLASYPKENKAPKPLPEHNQKREQHTVNEEPAVQEGETPPLVRSRRPTTRVQFARSETRDDSFIITPPSSQRMDRNSRALSQTPPMSTTVSPASPFPSYILQTRQRKPPAPYTPSAQPNHSQIPALSQATSRARVTPLEPTHTTSHSTGLSTPHNSPLVSPVHAPVAIAPKNPPPHKPSPTIFCFPSPKFKTPKKERTTELTLTPKQPFRHHSSPKIVK